MDKVIDLQEKIQSINNKKNEMEIKRKKALKKKTTFNFSYYELFVLIMELCDNLLYYDDITKDLLKNDCDENIELYAYSASHISRLVKRLYKLYLENDCFLDSKIQLSITDMETCIEALELTSDPFVYVSSKDNDTFTFEDKYEELEQYEKTVFYLYTIMKNERISILKKADSFLKQSLSKKELKKYEDREKYIKSLRSNRYNEAENKLYELYKNHYIEEYRSKIQFIYETTAFIGENPLWNVFFVKGNAKFNKFMAKYHYHKESKNFVYHYDWDLEIDRQLNTDINYFPQGWRFHGDVPNEEEYEIEIYISDDYEDFIEYKEYCLLKLKEEIENSEEMKDFKFDVIDYEKKDDFYYDFDRLNERLLDKFEMVIDTYSGFNNVIHSDGKIGYEFDKIILLAYI